jgi:hypothetical protein
VYEVVIGCVSRLGFHFKMVWQRREILWVKWTIWNCSCIKPIPAAVLFTFSQLQAMFLRFSPMGLFHHWCFAAYTSGINIFTAHTHNFHIAAVCCFRALTPQDYQQWSIDLSLTVWSSGHPKVNILPFRWLISWMFYDS